MSYIPSGSTVGSVLSSLSESLKEELSLPGNWSAQLWFGDLKRCPVRDKRLLAETILAAVEIPMSYLNFFEVTRGYPPVFNEIQKGLLEIFEKGSVMLYFESLFLDWFHQERPQDPNLLKYIRYLSGIPISQWNDVVEQIGAYSYQFFAQDPHSYSRLLTRVKDKDPEDLMDSEILEIFPEMELMARGRADLVRSYQRAQI